MMQRPSLRLFPRPSLPLSPRLFLRPFLRPALAALLGAAVLAGCAAPRPIDYAAERPAFDLKTYFNGDVVAHGIFTDRAGKIVKRFTVLMRCSWNGDEGVLDENFSYSDGSRQRRVWRITQLADAQGVRRYVGLADDIVGQAEGRAAGNALQWRYTLRLPVEGREIEVQFDDWMVLVDEQVLLNKAVMSKFGVRLGEVTLSFRKP